MRQAAVALIEKDGLFLSVSRKNDATKRGLPGGKRENKESLEDTMKRELWEEAGLKALEYEDFFVDYDGFDFQITCFLVTKFEGEAYSKEAGIVEWVEKEKLFDPPFGCYNKKVFEKYFKEVK
jgi:8-oxo-dGTP pyrophosphatase MutT (NUDIX family)